MSTIPKFTMPLTPSQAQNNSRREDNIATLSRNFGPIIGGRK